jgi:hypothetical protein
MGHLVHKCNKHLPREVSNYIYVLAKRYLVIEIEKKFGCRFYKLKYGLSNKWKYSLEANGKKYILNINWNV